MCGIATLTQYRRMERAVLVGSEVIANGEYTRDRLVRRFYPLYRNAYIPIGAEPTAALRARAAWLSTGATLAGLSAAAVYGTKWIDADLPAEIIRPDRHHPPGIVSHSWQLHPHEVCSRSGMTLTTPLRTAYDVGRCHLGDDGVIVLDALLAATRLTPDAVADFAAHKPGARGRRRLLAALKLVDPGAESPPETRLRLLLVRHRLPPVVTQIRLDELGIRLDMGWPRWKVAVEYDGLQHFADARQRARDIERWELLQAAGWRVVRVSAAMMSRPDGIVERVCAQLRAAGCPL